MNVSSAQAFLDATLVDKRQLADEVYEFSFRRADGEVLPAFSPGAHIDVLTPSGQTRSYSLTTGADGYRGTYDIAVAREPDGRGGSQSMHLDTSIGMTMAISPAIQSFPLRPAPEYMMIAGGIGITALRSMYHQARRAGIPVKLIYLVRTRAGAAYLEELCQASRPGAEVTVHVTEENAAERFDLWSVLARPTAGRVYCCASPAVLESVRLLTAHWRASRVHFEDFGGVSELGDFAEPFTVVWGPTGEVFQVPAEKSLLDALGENGVGIPSSCRTGTCGTCRVRVINGVVDHRDVVLDEQQQLSQLTACVSRGVGAITIGPCEEGGG